MGFSWKVLRGWGKARGERKDESEFLGQRGGGREDGEKRVRGRQWV